MTRELMSGLSCLWNDAYDAKAALDACRRPCRKKTRKMAKNGAFFERLNRHFKMHLCDVEPVGKMISEAIAAPARAPFGRKSAISVRIHASSDMEHLGEL
jgi:hypothetical protein